MWNNGDGVPVEVHKEEKVYVPELIFGHLLTSSNYDDNEQKVAVQQTGWFAVLGLNCCSSTASMSISSCCECLCGTSTYLHDASLYGQYMVDGDHMHHTGDWGKEWLWSQADKYFFH